MKWHRCTVALLLFCALFCFNDLRAQPLFESTAGSSEVLPEASRVVLAHSAASTTAIHALDLSVARSVEVAWLIAVPTPPTVGSVEPTLLDELDRLTAPSASNNRSTEAADSAGCTGPELDLGTGCVGSPSDSVAPYEPVVVIQRKLLEPLEVVLLTSSSGDDLATWLSDHGYAVPPRLSTIVQPYAAAGWTFVAVRIDPAAAVELGHGLVLVRLDYPDPQFVFASRTLALTPTAVAHLPLTLFVVAEERALTANQPAQTLQEFAPQGWWAAADYRTLLVQQLASDARLSWVVESAQRYGVMSFNVDSPTWELATELGLAGPSREERVYVTRLTTVATRLGAEAAPDLSLQLDAAAPSVPNYVEVPASAGLAIRGGAAWLPLALLAFVLWCRRGAGARRRRPCCLRGAS
ncbi:MAG: DUF2330 domain-containing protein [Deltaproteobacteria bacterium]|nr:DUF2330 domain-containing protein [Deltaproteobacteria bacterium]